MATGLDECQQRSRTDPEYHDVADEFFAAVVRQAKLRRYISWDRIAQVVQAQGRAAVRPAPLGSAAQTSTPDVVAQARIDARKESHNQSTESVTTS